MQENNPYQAPIADVSVESEVQLELQGPVSNSFGQGWRWFADAFGLFKLNAGMWIGMFIVYMIIMMVGSMIPFANMLMGFIAPVFTAGFMVACYKADTQGSAQFSDMFAGFKQQFGTLIRLGLLYILFSLVILAILGVIIYVMAGADILAAFGSMASNTSTPEDIQTVMPMLLIVILIGMLFWTPLIMAIWFAPALIILNEQGPWNAMVLSVKGSLKNILPFLLYGMLFMVFGILAMIPIGLGWLVLGPMIYISIYTAYKKIYLAS